MGMSCVFGCRVILRKLSTFGEEVDADDGRAKQRSVFAWQAVNLVNGPAVTRDGGPAAPTAAAAAAAAAAPQV